MAPIKLNSKMLNLVGSYVNSLDILAVFRSLQISLF
jgi:hypothetical protein